jgi:hypothetical protein
MEDAESVIPTDEELRKRLFSTPSPNKTARESEEDDRAAGKRPSNGRGARPRRKPRKAGFRLNLPAVMLFLLLCAFALVAALHPDDDSWRKITWDRAKEGKNMNLANDLPFVSTNLCLVVKKDGTPLQSGARTTIQSSLANAFTV